MTYGSESECAIHYTKAPLVDQARLLASCSSGSGDWLHALPISSVGLKMDNATVRISASLRLGAPVVRPHLHAFYSWASFTVYHRWKTSRWCYTSAMETRTLSGMGCYLSRHLRPVCNLRKQFTSRLSGSKVGPGTDAIIRRHQSIKPQVAVTRRRLRFVTPPLLIDRLNVFCLVVLVAECVICCHGKYVLDNWNHSEWQEVDLGTPSFELVNMTIIHWTSTWGRQHLFHVQSRTSLWRNVDDSETELLNAV